MKTDYITPESAADQNPTEKNVERLTEKKQPTTPTPNPGKNEGHNYGKGAPEETDELSDVEPNAKLNTTVATTAGGGQENSPQPEPDSTNQEQFEQETGPATAPEKTREAPKAQ